MRVTPRTKRKKINNGPPLLAYLLQYPANLIGNRFFFLLIFTIFYFFKEWLSGLLIPFDMIRRSWRVPDARLLSSLSLYNYFYYHISRLVFTFSLGYYFVTDQLLLVCGATFLADCLKKSFLFFLCTKQSRNPSSQCSRERKNSVWHLSGEMLFERACRIVIRFFWQILYVLFYSFIADHIRSFTCGKLYYRTSYLDAQRDVLYVGAM